MRVFKKQISSTKLLLIASLVSNLLLISTVYVAEKHSHIFQSYLAKHGIVSFDDKLSSDYWARIGWTNTIAKLNINFDIAFFGNSITRGSDFQKYFPDKRIINLGYSGDNILGMIKRIPMLQSAHPKKIFIMAGTNDLVHIDLDTYKQRYTNLIQAISDSLPQSKIYIESVLPSNHEMADYATPNNKIIAANKIAEQIAELYNCEFVNLYNLYVGKDNELPKEITRDGVHLFPENYDRWADKIKPMIYE